MPDRDQTIDLLRALRDVGVTPPPAQVLQARVSSAIAEEIERDSRDSGQLVERLVGRRRRIAHTQLMSGLVPVVAVALTLVIVVGAIVLLAGHHQSRSPAAPAASKSRQALLSVLGVLRQPQTRADLHSPVIAQYLQQPDDAGLAALNGTPDLALIRRATVTPWGSPVYLVPNKPPPPAALARLQRQFPTLPVARIEAARRAEGVTEVDRSGSGGDATAAEIQAGQAISTEGAGRSFAGGATQTRFIAIVPDGVAKVSFVDPHQPSPHRHSATVTVPVHGNVAAAQLDREGSGGAMPMIWYSSNGAVIKRIGSFHTVNQTASQPKPGPSTAQSRAAERDPSTPNRVWVTPSSGDEHAHYTVHFRVLLNDADYRYRVTGAHCSRITFAGGSGGGNNDVRGRIWSAQLDAVDGQTWCPGAYRVSVTLMDLGRYGNLKRPARPFGTAPFKVRP